MSYLLLRMSGGWKTSRSLQTSSSEGFAGGGWTADPAFWDCSHGPSVRPPSPLLAQFSHLDAATACFELLFTRFLLVIQNREPRHLHLDMISTIGTGGVFSVDLWAKCDPDLSPPDSDPLKTM